MIIRLGEVTHDEPFDYCQEPFFVVLLSRDGSEELGSFAPISWYVAERNRVVLCDGGEERRSRAKIAETKTNQPTYPKSPQYKKADRRLHPKHPRTEGGAGDNNSERKNRFHLPGNSVSEVGERMNGGAVKEDRSPENAAILINV